MSQSLISRYTIAVLHCIHFQFHTTPSTHGILKKRNQDESCFKTSPSFLAIDRSLLHSWAWSRNQRRTVMDLSSLAGDKRSLLGRIWSSLRTPLRWSAKGGGVRPVIICNIPAGNDSRISPVIFTNVRSVSEPREARNKRDGMDGKIGGKIEGNSQTHAATSNQLQ